MADLEKIAKELSELSVLEAAELVKNAGRKMGRFRRCPRGYGCRWRRCPGCC